MTRHVIDLGRETASKTEHGPDVDPTKPVHINFAANPGTVIGNASSGNASAISYTRAANGTGAPGLGEYRFERNPAEGRYETVRIHGTTKDGASIASRLNVLGGMARIRFNNVTGYVMTASASGDHMVFELWFPSGVASLPAVGEAKNFECLNWYRIGQKILGRAQYYDETHPNEYMRHGHLRDQEARGEPFFQAATAGEHLRENDGNGAPAEGHWRFSSGARTGLLLHKTAVGGFDRADDYSLTNAAGYVQFIADDSFTYSGTAYSYQYGGRFDYSSFVDRGDYLEFTGSATDTRPDGFPPVLRNHPSANQQLPFVSRSFVETNRGPHIITARTFILRQGGRFAIRKDAFNSPTTLWWTIRYRDDLTEPCTFYYHPNPGGGREAGYIGGRNDHKWYTETFQVDVADLINTRNYGEHEAWCIHFGETYGGELIGCLPIDMFGVADDPNQAEDFPADLQGYWPIIDDAKNPFSNIGQTDEYVPGEGGFFPYGVYLNDNPVHTVDFTTSPSGYRTPDDGDLCTWKIMADCHINSVMLHLWDKILDDDKGGQVRRGVGGGSWQWHPSIFDENGDPDWDAHSPKPPGFSKKAWPGFVTEYPLDGDVYHAGRHGIKLFVNPLRSFSWRGAGGPTAKHFDSRGCLDYWEGVIKYWAAKGEPNIGGWKPIDEWDHDTSDKKALQFGVQLNRVMKEAGSQRPCVTTIMNHGRGLGNDAWRCYIHDAFDVGANDNYFQDGLTNAYYRTLDEGIVRVGQQVDQALKGIDRDRQAYIHIPLIHPSAGGSVRMYKGSLPDAGIDKTTPNVGFRLQHAREVRAQAYMAITHGAKGMIFFYMPHPNNDLIKYNGIDFNSSGYIPIPDVNGYTLWDTYYKGLKPVGEDLFVTEGGIANALVAPSKQLDIMGESGLFECPQMGLYPGGFPGSTDPGGPVARPTEPHWKPIHAIYVERYDGVRLLIAVCAADPVNVDDDIANYPVAAEFTINDPAVTDGAKPVALDGGTVNVVNGKFSYTFERFERKVFVLKGDWQQAPSLPDPGPGPDPDPTPVPPPTEEIIVTENINADVTWGPNKIVRVRMPELNVHGATVTILENTHVYFEDTSGNYAMYLRPGSSLEAVGVSGAPVRLFGERDSVGRPLGKIRLVSNDTTYGTCKLHWVTSDGVNVHNGGPRNTYDWYRTVFIDCNIVIDPVDSRPVSEEPVGYFEECLFFTFVWDRTEKTWSQGINRFPRGTGTYAYRCVMAGGAWPVQFLAGDVKDCVIVPDEIYPGNTNQQHSHEHWLGVGPDADVSRCFFIGRSKGFFMPLESINRAGPRCRFYNNTAQAFGEGEGIVWHLSKDPQPTDSQFWNNAMANIGPNRACFQGEKSWSNEPNRVTYADFNGFLSIDRPYELEYLYDPSEPDPQGFIVGGKNLGDEGFGKYDYIDGDYQRHFVDPDFGYPFPYDKAALKNRTVNVLQVIADYQAAYTLLASSPMRSNGRGTHEAGYETHMGAVSGSGPAPEPFRLNDVNGVDVIKDGDPIFINGLFPTGTALVKVNGQVIQVASKTADVIQCPAIIATDMGMNYTHDTSDVANHEQILTATLTVSVAGDTKSLLIGLIPADGFAVIIGDEDNDNIDLTYGIAQEFGATRYDDWDDEADLDPGDRPANKPRDQWVTVRTAGNSAIALQSDSNLLIMPAADDGTEVPYWYWDDLRRTWTQSSYFLYRGTDYARWIQDLEAVYPTVGANIMGDLAPFADGDEPRTYEEVLGEHPATLVFNTDGTYSGFVTDLTPFSCQFKVSNVHNPAGDLSNVVWFFPQDVKLFGPVHDLVTYDSADVTVSTTAENATIYYVADRLNKQPSHDQIVAGYNEGGLDAEKAGSLPVTAAGQQAWQDLQALLSEQGYFVWWTIVIG